MAYLLISEPREGDKEWRVYSQERDAQDAALERRAGGDDATVVNTSLADPHDGSMPLTIASVAVGFRL